MLGRFFIFLIIYWVTAFHSYAASPEIEQLLQEARQQAFRGDFEGSAVTYRKILALQKDHPDAKRELSQVLTGSKMSDAYDESTE